MTERPTGRIQLTGLTDDEEQVIRDAARWSRKTIKDYVIDQSRATMREAQESILKAAGGTHRPAC
jgi:uncharacterized protein (DUF1778 family)